MSQRMIAASAIDQAHSRYLRELGNRLRRERRRLTRAARVHRKTGRAIRRFLNEYAF